MATRTATRNGNAPKLGVPTGKFLALSQKTNKPGPYEITDVLTVEPPTKKRNEQMRDAERRQLIGQAQLNIAYNLSNVPAPPMPAPPVEVKPAPLEDEGEQAPAAAAKAQQANTDAQAQYKRDLDQWKQDVTVWRANLEQAQQQIGELNDQVRRAEADWDRAFLGPQHDEIVEFFDDLDESLWLEFRNDLRRHWVPSQPADDLDIEDEEEAGKALKSSTG